MRFFIPIFVLILFACSAMSQGTQVIRTPLTTNNMMNAPQDFWIPIWNNVAKKWSNGVNTASATNNAQPPSTVLSNLTATGVAPGATNASAYIGSSTGRGTNTSLMNNLQFGNGDNAGTTTISNVARFRWQTHMHDQLFMDALTGDRLLYVDPGQVVQSLANVSSTEAGFLDGVTSGIQAQIDAISSGGPFNITQFDASGSVTNIRSGAQVTNLSSLNLTNRGVLVQQGPQTNRSGIYMDNTVSGGSANLFLQAENNESVIGLFSTYGSGIPSLSLRHYNGTPAARLPTLSGETLGFLIMDGFMSGTEFGGLVIESKAKNDWIAPDASAIVNFNVGDNSGSIGGKTVASWTAYGMTNDAHIYAKSNLVVSGLGDFLANVNVGMTLTVVGQSTLIGLINSFAGFTPGSTNVIHSLSEDATPANGDFVMVEDLSAGLLKKVQLSNLPGGSGAAFSGLSNSMTITTGGGVLTNAFKMVVVETNQPLKAIVEAQTRGTVVLLGAGTNFIGNNIINVPHGVSIRGLGARVSFIHSTAQITGVVNPGSDSVHEDYGIVQGPPNGTYFIPWGCTAGQKAFTNVTASRLYIEAESDIFYFSNALPVVNCFITDCYSKDKYDGILMAVPNPSYIRISECNFFKDQNGATIADVTNGVTGAGPIRFQRGKIELVNNHFTVTNLFTNLIVRTQPTLIYDDTADAGELIMRDNTFTLANDVQWLRFRGLGTGKIYATDNNYINGFETGPLLTATAYTNGKYTNSAIERVILHQSGAIRTNVLVDASMNGGGLFSGYQVTICDDTATASGTNIVVMTQFGQTIDGAATATLTRDRECRTFMIRGTNWITVATTTLAGGVDQTNQVLVNLIGTVANNVTNENSGALQINAGVMSLTPGVLSNVVASGHGAPYIAVSTNGGALNNVTSLVFRTPSVTLSNDSAGIASVHVAASGGAGSTNNVAQGIGTSDTTNAVKRHWVYFSGDTNVVVDWTKTNYYIVSPSNTFTVSWANAPSAGGLAQSVRLTVINTNSTSGFFPTNGLNGTPVIMLSAPSTNTYLFNFDGTNFWTDSGQILTTGLGDTNVFNVSPTIHSPILPTGASSNRAPTRSFALVLTNANGMNEWSPVVPALRSRRRSWLLPTSTTIGSCGHGEQWSLQAGSVSFTEASSTLPSALFWNAPATIGNSNSVNGNGFKFWQTGRGSGINWTGGNYLPSTNAMRFWFGLTSGTAAQLNGSQPNFRFAAFRYDSETEGTYRFVTANAGSAWTTNNTGVPVVINQHRHFEIVEDVANATWYGVIDGVTVATNTSNLPSGNMQSMVHIATLEAVSKTNYVSYIEVTGNY